ncbi:class I glutamine amidotransferase-like protein [Podospora australis]|uniref:D-lactate dehydratase n=1 Tax=Podospora australis TaxID=1536484 RepID=A0AAN6WXH4_9PEZI|nr:class I glutamine amidotransferase-like protein [Podospora australis]
MAPKVLIVLSSHSELGTTGKKTGWYLSEFAHPYKVLKDAGVSMTIASPSGGAAPLDPSSVEAAKDDSVSVDFLHNNSALWEVTHKVSDFLGKADEFDAIFFPGGHGPMFDLPLDKDSNALIKEFWEKEKVVSAVCHGPAALVNVKLGNGELLLKGKQVTGFSNSEEDAVGLSSQMPFLLEDKLKEAGTKYDKTGDWGEKVIVDGRLITGQNPASAHGVGEAILKAIKA